MLKPRFLLLVPVLLLALTALAVACGDDADDAAEEETQAAPSAATEEIPLTAPEDAIATGSGLKYVDVEAGDGAQPGLSQTVVVHYRGLLTDGTEFDSSLGGAPAEFPLNGVIPGFAEGISTMKVGGKRILYIPSALGYGPQGYPGVIPGNADLVFEVELLEIR